jgi:hypothetical protein
MGWQQMDVLDVIPQLTVLKASINKNNGSKEEKENKSSTTFPVNKFKMLSKQNCHCCLRYSLIFHAHCEKGDEEGQQTQ